MDLFTIIGAALRRWYVTLPVLALAGVLAFQAYQAVPSVYASSASVTVLPPVAPAPEVDPETGEEVEPYETNPYSGPGLAATVLARNINSTSFQERLGLEENATATVEADPSSRDPIIEITATGSTPDQVMSLLTEVAVQSEIVLDEFQAEAGATEGARYRLAPAVPADLVEDVTPSRFRTAGAIAVMGMGMAAALAVAADMALDRRRAGAPGRRVRPGSRSAEEAPAPGPRRRDGRETAAGAAQAAEAQPLPVPATATAGTPATAPAGTPATAPGGTPATAPGADDRRETPRKPSPSSDAIVLVRPR